MNTTPPLNVLSLCGASGIELQTQMCRPGNVYHLGVIGIRVVRVGALDDHGVERRETRIGLRGLRVLRAGNRRELFRVVLPNFLVDWQYFVNNCE